MNLLRWISPSQLVFCLVLFFLPWVEVQCNLPKDFKNPKAAANFDPKDLVWTPFVQQSGLEAATGKYTFVDPELQQAAEKSKDKKGPDAAPLLWGFLIAMIAGIAIGFAVPSSALKKGLMVLCCVVALGTAGGQAALGFPITKDVREQSDKGNMKMPMKLDEAIKTTLKPAFYITLFFCLGALVTAAIEPTSQPPPAGRKKRKKKEVEEADDEEVEEGERGDEGTPGNPFKF